MNRYPRLVPRLLCLLSALLLGACATTAGVEKSTDPDIAAFETDDGEAGYHLLLAELALERNLYAEAAREYRMSAELSDDPEIAQRATTLGAETGFDAEALLSAARWVELQPQNSDALSQLARMNLRLGKADGAVSAIEKLLALTDKPEEGFLSVTGIMLESPKADTALRAMKKLAGRYSKVSAAQYGMGLLLLQAGELDEAEKYALAAEQLKDDWQQPGLLHARILVARGDVEAGLERAAAIARSTNEPSLRLDYALLLANLDREGEARLELDLLLGDHPRMAGALRAAGLLELRRGDLDSAQMHFTSLLATGRSTWEAFYYLGTIADHREQSARAVRYYSQVRDGELVLPAQIRAAGLYRDLGETDRGVAHLLEVAGDLPKFNAELTIAAAEMVSKSGDKDRALELFNDVLARYPGHRPARFSRAFLYEETQQLDLSIAEMRLLLKEQPKDPIALNALGYTLADHSVNMREAFTLIKRALELDPNNPAIIDSMGWVEYRRGNLEQALVHLQLAYAMIKDAEVAAHLAEVLAVKGETESAQIVLRDAMAQHPESKALTEVAERFGL